LKGKSACRLRAGMQGRYGASGGDEYSLASGIYFYKLQAGNFVETKKMVLIK